MLLVALKNLLNLLVRVLVRSTLHLVKVNTIYLPSSAIPGVVNNRSNSTQIHNTVYLKNSPVFLDPRSSINQSRKARRISRRPNPIFQISSIPSCPYTLCSEWVQSRYNCDNYVKRLVDEDSASSPE